MKKTIPLLMFLILALMIVSCKKRINQDNIEVIKINLDDKNREKLDVSFDLIRLDTSDKSMIGYIGKVKYFDGRYYILNNNRFTRPSLYAFDKSGKFIRATAIGRGPGEAVEAFAFTINKQDSVIVLHDQVSKPTLIYDLNLNFKYKIEHERRFIEDLYHINKDTFLIYYNIPKRDSKGEMLDDHYSCTIYTNDFKKEEHIEILTKIGDNISLQSPVSILNHNVLFMFPLDNKIYELVKGKAKLRYILDFGKYNLSPNELNDKTLDDIIRLMTEGSRIFPVGICRSQDFFVINSRYNDSASTFFYSNKNKKIYYLNDCINSKMIPDCVIKGITEKDDFFGIIQPSELIKFQQSGGKLGDIKISENDNPYIILLKIRLP